MQEQPYRFRFIGDGILALEALDWISARDGTLVGLLYDRIITPKFFNLIGSARGAKALEDYDAAADERLVVVCKDPVTKSKLINAAQARQGKFVSAIHSSVKSENSARSAREQSSRQIPQSDTAVRSGPSCRSSPAARLPAVRS